ncbi:MAG: hypothetical protein EXS36_00910 [Pedosphaera sp.]|nr:hypothetical protein [Pedosphaera sp.]
MKIHTTQQITRKGLPTPSRPWMALACSLALAGGFATIHPQAATVVPPSYKVTADTSKPGFIWRIFANQANQANSYARTEDALAGLLVDADGNPLPNLADPAQ